MVVIIKSPHSLQRVMNYNEQKCLKDQAECIYAGNYLQRAEHMNFYEKMERMQDLISRNERAKKSNTLHISINFDPSEKLDKARLAEIAQAYMERIGFGNQPYLVYEHRDAGHPHIHVITTTIQADGKRIDTYNIGRNRSEKARKEIEKEYRLIRAQGRKPEHTYILQPVEIQKAQYGKSETRRAISNTVDFVVNKFKYTSLAELNAVLKQYNVEASRSEKNSIIYKNGGLLYHLLDGKGKKIGIPIKASNLQGQPTLKKLDTRFKENEQTREADKKMLKASIDWALSKNPQTLDKFQEMLRKEKITSVLRQNKEGFIYGITFVDFRSKSVFNGSSIGKEYSIAGLQKNFTMKGNETIQGPKLPAKSIQEIKNEPLKTEAPHEKTGDSQDLLKDLMDTEKNWNRIPGELLKKKRKRQNKNH